LSDNPYSAPFGLNGSNPIDNAVVDKLLTAALARGGDYADLFFEYNISGSYSLDEGILKSAGRSVSLGLGVRVMKGDATGYAYVQNLELEAMLEAASTAARIASENSAKAFRGPSSA